MKAASLFLDGIRLNPPGAKWQFLYHKDQRWRHSLVGGFGFEFFCNFDKLKRASLLLIQENPTLLAGMSIQAVTGLMQKFFQESLGIIGTGAFFKAMGQDVTALQLTTDETKTSFSEKLIEFLQQELKPATFLMPVSCLRCHCEKSTGNLMWVGANFDLDNILSESGFPRGRAVSGIFPPIKSDNKFRFSMLEPEDSWFIARASAENVAEDRFRRMAGALCVVIEHPYAHRISQAEQISGRAAFRSEGVNFNVYQKCTVPPILSPYKFIEDANSVFWTLCETTNSRIGVCLEYLSEAWGKSSVISFINNSIAIDALFGIKGHFKNSILAGVEKHSQIQDVRSKYELILSLRNGILHGDFSSLELAPQYLAFYDKFNADPIDEQRRIISDCLKNIARDGFQPYFDPSNLKGKLQ